MDLGAEAKPIIQGLQKQGRAVRIERDPELRRETRVKQSKATQSNNITERKQVSKNKYFT